MDGIKFWVSLNRVPQLGMVRFRKLEDYSGWLDKAWEASPSELRAAGIEERLAREIVGASSCISPDTEMDRLAQAGVEAINWYHP